MINANLKKTNANKEQILFQRYFNKAVQYQSQSEIGSAIELYAKALQYNNNHLPTIQILATLLHQSEHYTKALHYYSLAVELHVHSATLHNGLGNCYEHCQQWNKAKEHYLNAVDLRQDYAEALNNLGNIYRKMGDYQQAEFCLLRALRLCINVPTLVNLGLLMTEMLNYAQAHSFYDHALRLQPFNNEIKWHKALLLLTEGELKQGWELYTSSDNQTQHFNTPNQTKELDTHNIDFFKHKTIYIKGKQSINDEIMLASCLQEVIKHAKKCYIECDNRLITLFQRAFTDAEIFSKNEYHHLSNANSQIDLTISMVDIAKNLRQSFSSFPNQSHYLSASETLLKHWQQQFSQHGKSIKIGIAWRSNASDEATKSSSELKLWETIFAQIDCLLINLQYGQIEKELQQFNRAILDWPESNHQHNIEQLAAQIVGLDLIITSNNLVAHLAGALGKPVWIILPFAANWRWFNGKNPCPWYPSAKIFKQKTPGNYLDVFEELNQQLLTLHNVQQDTLAKCLSLE